MFYNDLHEAFEPYKNLSANNIDYDALYAEFERIIIANFPPRATCTKEFNERPIIIKQQQNAWKLFVEKELKAHVIWIGEDLYRDTIKKKCFKDAASAERMFKYLNW